MTSLQAIHRDEARQIINWRAFDYYPSLDKVRRFTEANFEQELRLASVASVAGMECTYFSSFFRRKVGIRFTDWLSYLRVSHAMQRISIQDEPITHTAFAVGFSDLRTFERAFRRITQMTAREYKRIARPV